MTLPFLPLCSAVLGGSTESDQTSFVSRKSSILIFEAVLKKLIPFLHDSSFSWVRDACTMLTSGAVKSSFDVTEMAQFSLQVLDGSFFCLQTLSEESELVPCILAAIFVINWEYSMETSISNTPKNEAKVGYKAKVDFGDSVHAFFHKRSSQFRKSLSMQNLKRLQNILVQCIRSAMFTEDKPTAEDITSLCCMWMLQVLSSFCQDQLEEQDLLNQLLHKNDTWPLWTVPDFSSAWQLVIRKASANAHVGNCNFDIYDDVFLFFFNAFAPHFCSPSYRPSVTCYYISL